LSHSGIVRRQEYLLQPPVWETRDERQTTPVSDEAASMVLPVIAGLSIAAGAALVGIGMGSSRRSKIVPADSPKADEGRDHQAALR
jgi:hypothetical protein